MAITKALAPTLEPSAMVATRITEGEFPGLKRTLVKLVDYCEANRWCGHDPYDALNSRCFEALPILDGRWGRLAMTQLLKRSPVNLRPVLRIPPSENPKALGLFLSAFVQLARMKWPNARELVDYFIGRLEALSSGGAGEYCWGYSFPWQTRAVLVKRGAPNLVCTVFVANALLDAFEFTESEKCLRMALSAARYVADELYWEDGKVAGFGYPTKEMRTQVHNANFLGASLLCRASRYADEPRLALRALKVARHSAAMQAEDGAWLYGEASTQAWIDNFHTGFNLSALQCIGDKAGTQEFEAQIRCGFDFYLKHFITPEGVARYFHNRTYPIDIHCVAQTLITLTEFRHLSGDAMRIAGKVYEWAMENMWSESGYFYYRKLRHWTIRTPFMRWSEVWMVQALASVLAAVRTPAAQNGGNTA